MIRIKSLEDYTNYFGVCCRFWKSKEKYHLQTLLDNEILERLQFKKYEDNNLKDKMYKLVSYEEIDNAYSVSFFAFYKGLKFFVENVIKNDIFTLRSLEEAMIFFNDFPKQGYDPIYEIKESEVTDVWEERTPIKGFKFEEEPIVYLKKNGVWLVEH